MKRAFELKSKIFLPIKPRWPDNLCMMTFQLIETHFVVASA